MKNMKLEYNKNDMTKEWLIENGFKYCKAFSDYNTDTYIKRFPVYKYNKKTVVLEGELRVILGDDRIILNVFNADNGIEKYAPFYYSEYGNHKEVLKIIWKKFEKELNKLDIKCEYII